MNCLENLRGPFSLTSQWKVIYMLDDLENSEIRDFFRKAIAKNVGKEFNVCYKDAQRYNYLHIFLEGLRRANDNIDYFCTHLSKGTLNNRWPNDVYCLYWNQAEKNGWDTYLLLRNMEKHFCTHERDEKTGQVFYIPAAHETHFNHICRTILLTCLNRILRQELADPEKLYSIPDSLNTIQDKVGRFLTPTLTKLIQNPENSLEKRLEMPTGGIITKNKFRFALKKAGYYDPNKDETLRDL